jgi:lysophospholipase L1-like esterase
LIVSLPHMEHKEPAMKKPSSVSGQVFAVFFLALAATFFALVETASAQNKRVLVFGDSNSWGSSARVEGQPVTRLSDDVRWAGVLQTALGREVAVVVDGLVGRTTDLDLPAGFGAVPSGSDFNGAKALPAALAREMPLDLVIIMLGTNDLLPVFGRSADEIAAAAVRVAELVARSPGGAATSYPAPKVLLVAPPVIGVVSRAPMRELFGDAQPKARLLGPALVEAARRSGVPIVDASAVTTVDGADGVHLTAANHRLLGLSVAEAARRLLAAN